MKIAFFLMASFGIASEVNDVTILRSSLEKSENLAALNLVTAIANLLK